MHSENIAVNNEQGFSAFQFLEQMLKSSFGKVANNDLNTISIDP